MYYLRHALWAAVCALHEHAAHTCCKLFKKFKSTNKFDKQTNECVFFPEGASPLWTGLISEPLESRKVVFREECTEDYLR